jgi:hypothetical protein
MTPPILRRLINLRDEHKFAITIYIEFVSKVVKET